MWLFHTAFELKNPPSFFHPLPPDLNPVLTFLSRCPPFSHTYHLCSPRTPPLGNATHNVSWRRSGILKMVFDPWLDQSADTEKDSLDPRVARLRWQALIQMLHGYDFKIKMSLVILIHVVLEEALSLPFVAPAGFCNPGHPPHQTCGGLSPASSLPSFCVSSHFPLYAFAFLPNLERTPVPLN